MTAPFSNPARIIDLHHQGLSHRQIAQQLGCHHRTVQRHLEVNRKAREESERDAVRGWLDEKRREREYARLVEIEARIERRFYDEKLEPVEDVRGASWEQYVISVPSPFGPIDVETLHVVDDNPKSGRWFRRAP